MSRPVRKALIAGVCAVIWAAGAAAQSVGQIQAGRSAALYLQMSGFSRQGLIEQLSSPYGDRYDRADATAAVDALAVDWNAQAARAAGQYLTMMGFSCQGLIDQLASEHGERFTRAEAEAGARAAGAC